MDAQQAADLAAQTADKLKPGTWDAVSALALVSIAQSLATIAAAVAAAVGRGGS